MGRMTQTERILNHLRRCGSITPLDALREFGCMRLGARIYDLKKAGYDIESRIESHKNSYGERVSYARYTLKESA